MATRRNVTPPNLPIATKQYEQRYQEQLNNTNRLFYTSVANAVNAPRAYGQFYTSGTIENRATPSSPLTANVARLVPFSVTSTAFNTNIGTTNTRLYVAETGVYNVQFSAQCDLSTGSNGTFYFWLKQNGTNIPDSAGKVLITNHGAAVMAAWNWVLTLQEGDYIELAWSSADIHAILLEETNLTGPVRPDVPAVILTITWVSPYNISAGIS